MPPRCAGARYPSRFFSRENMGFRLEHLEHLRESVLKRLLKHIGVTVVIADVVVVVVVVVAIDTVRQ